jgi:glycerol uptake facilitator-like aquaporin
MATKSAIKSTNKTTTTHHQSNVSETKKVRKMPTSYNSMCKAIKDMPIIGSLGAEFLGAFILTAVFIEMQGNPLYVAFALVGIVLFTGSVTGANPAMTVGALVTKKITWLRAIAYIVVQLLGASVAYFVLNAFLHANDPTSAQLAAGSAAPSLLHAAEVVKGKEWYLFFVELLGSTILALGVASAFRTKRHIIVASFAAGLAILSALFISLILSMPFTKLLTEQGVILTFLNPALAFAAKGLSWSTWPLAIYVLAPVIGGIIGFVIQDFMHCASSKDCDCAVCKA